MSIQMVARADRLRVERSGDNLGWLLLIPLGCLVLAQVGLAWSGVLGVLDGVLADPDSYMRLNRVIHLHESGSWFDSTYPRIGPPDGHVQHWTRPLDALLLAGAWLFEPFLGFRTGLHVWGVLLSPICLALTILALNWASAPVLPRDARMIACLLLLLQPTVIGFSSLGRADHHTLLFLLFVLLLGATARLLLERDASKIPLAAGAITALAVWVSPEALVFIAASLATLSLYWLFGDRPVAERCRSLLGWTTGFLALALLVERGPAGLFASENDRLSIVHVTLFALVALFWTIITPLEARYRLEFRHRLPLAGCGLAVSLGAMLALFPALIEGPLGTVDPLYRELRLERILEIQPLIRPDWLAAGDYGLVLGALVPVLGIALFAVPFLANLIRSETSARRFWAPIALALLLFLPLAVHQVRWSSYVQILLIVPYAAFVHWQLNQLAHKVAEPWLSLVRPFLIVPALFWPILADAALPRVEPTTIRDACSLAEMGPALNRLADDKAMTVMAHADLGSELLYRTHHSVLSMPNHRPQAGFTATYRVLTSADDPAARRLLAGHEVDWILLCPSAVERSLFEPAERGGPTLYERLVEGEPPAWLRRIEFPQLATGKPLLYAVEKSAASRPEGTESGR